MAKINTPKPNTKAEIEQLELEATRTRLLAEKTYYNKQMQLLDALPTFAQDEDEDQWLISGKYTEQEKTDMRENIRTMYWKSPIVRGVIETMVNFIIGKNAKIDCLDELNEVQDYIDGWIEYNNWDLRSKEIIRRCMRDGEVFLRRFDPKPDSNYRSIRFIDPNEIQNPKGQGYFGDHSYGIECDPDDIETPLFYYRTWTTKDNQIHWEKIPADEIIHIKILVDSDVKRGISFLAGSAGFIKKYESWLDDRIRLNRIRHFFNVVGEPVGSSSTSTLADKFSDVEGKTAVGGTPKKKLPKPGTVLLTKGVKWDLKSLNINASDTADDGRAIQLMIAVGTHLTEYVIRGDASNANYSSTMVSESPMVKSFDSWQDFFEKPFKKIVKEEIEYGIDKGYLPQKSKATLTVDRREKKDDQGNVIEPAGKKQIRKTVNTNTDCIINFATLIHRDIKTETEAIIAQNAAGLVSKKTGSAQLGYDYDEEQEQIQQEEEEEESRAKKQFDNEFMNQDNPDDDENNDDK